MYIEFEWDPFKNTANLLKHGIGFEQACLLWQDPNMLEIPARTQGEPRVMIIGKIDELHWSAIITYRSERVRIISVRRARKEERELYEENFE